MEPEAKYALVGSVVLVLLAMLVAAVVWLKSAGVRLDYMLYTVYFTPQSLDGLQINGDVKLRGIKVGAVSDFRISSRRPGSAEVVIKVGQSTPIRQNTRASVERQLLTGIASIRLVTPSEDSPPLTQTPENEPYPVLAEGDSDSRGVAESLNQIAVRADETMQRINVLLSDQNQEAFAVTLLNLRRASAKVDKTLVRLDNALLAVDGAANEVRHSSAQVSSGANQLGLKAGDAVQGIQTSIKTIQAEVTRLVNRTDALATDSGLEIRLTARELRTAADSLGTVARRFGDPKRILFGPDKGSLGPGEGAP
jgi:phospholipid/cholesterol/gamma-HCH transport system substrate-binding protein